MPLSKVFIYLPVYNGADRAPDGNVKLSRQLDSILAQTFADFTLLVIDNASTDETPEIVRQYAARDSRIEIHRNHKNLGFFSSMTLGMMNGFRHEYLIYASHNDYWHPEYLEECVRALDENPDAALAYSHCRIMDLKNDQSVLYKDDFDLTGPDPGQRYLTLLAGLGLCNSFYGLMRSSHVFENFKYLYWESAAADNFLLACLAYAGAFIQIPRPLFFREMAAEKYGESYAERFARMQRLEAQTSTTFFPNVSPFAAHIWAHCRFISSRVTYYHHDGHPVEGLAAQVREKLIIQTVRILKGRYQELVKQEETLALAGLSHVLESWSNEMPSILSFMLLETERMQSIQRWANISVPGWHYGRALRGLAQGRPREALLAVTEELAASPTHRPSLELKAQLDAALSPPKQD